jgi:hypothetical protein
VHTAAALFQRICYENKDALSAGIIVAGWDKDVGPSVYNIPLGGGLFRQPWAIGGMSFDVPPYYWSVICGDRLWFNICVWLLRCHLQGRMGSGRDCGICEEQYVHLAVLFPSVRSLICVKHSPLPCLAMAHREVLFVCV